MKLIKLTQGKQTMVDDKDYEELNKHKWYAAKNIRKYYVMRRKDKHKVFLHREILGLGRGNKLQVDHINGNGLDNRRANIRVCTSAQNSHNQSKNRVNTSGYKGVCWLNRDKKFCAYIRIGGKRKYLGAYVTALKAAQAYDVAAKKYFGAFAKTNF